MAGGALDTRDLTLTAADGNRVAAFAVRAPNPDGIGILIYPDVRGLFHFYEELAMRFAEAGHDAIAFDYYGRTAGAAKRDADFDYMPHNRETTNAGVAADAVAAAAYLRSPEGGAVRGLVTVGFCFGGRNSLLAAAERSGVHPSGVIAFYGQLASRGDQPGPLELAAELRAPILGLYGGQDQSIPREQLAQFDSALTAAGVEHELHIYDRATHSFFDRRAEEFASEAEDAWRRALGFVDARAARHT